MTLFTIDQQLMKITIATVIDLRPFGDSTIILAIDSNPAHLHRDHVTINLHMPASNQTPFIGHHRDIALIGGPFVIWIGPVTRRKHPYQQQ